jgi:hypothetical protein
MTIDFGTALVVLALLASLVLTFAGGARAIPAIALVVCLIEALIAFHVIKISSPKLRIDVVLAIALAVVGGVCWSRAAAKAAVTAATVIALVGVIQLVLALRVFA